MRFPAKATPFFACAGFALHHLKDFFPFSHSCRLLVRCANLDGASSHSKNSSNDGAHKLSHPIEQRETHAYTYIEKIKMHLAQIITLSERKNYLKHYKQNTRKHSSVSNFNKKTKCL